MTKVRVIAKRDFIESITSSSRPLPALAELIWNGFDARSERVDIYLTKNEIDAIDSITVKDDGDGIEHSKVEQLFGNLGDSWKKSKGKLNGRALHGKNGRGRFKAFGLGTHVEWQTVFRKDGKPYYFSVIGKINTLDDFEVTDPIECEQGKSTGTTVHIYNLQKNFRSLQNESVPHELAKIFAAYLTEYPGIILQYDGKLVDPKDAQRHKAEYQLNEIVLESGEIVRASLSIVEWNIPTDRTIHLCDANGVALHEISSAKKIRAPGFHFTIYIKSDYFRELDKASLLCVSDLHPGVQHILNVATAKVKSHFRNRLADEQSVIVETWKKANIYPYEEKTDIGPIEMAERQVFDILAVNVQSYLPSFENSDNKSKKFTFSLLAQALRQNPESVQVIIGEVLGLKKETQDELANLLKQTTLSSIISSSKVVANRLNFLAGLETLLFDPESKQKLLERDQLHKILEKEAWIFHEEFTLAGSEQRLEEVLQKHLTELGKREDSSEIVDLGDGKTGRIDLMLQKAVQPRTGEFDYLIVELKRPRQKVNSDVLTQIEKYAIAVANDERFDGIKARWNFLVVSNELDDFVKRKSRQRNKPNGLVFEDGELNITVWAKSWSEVIGDARAKLAFINQQLQYKANSESAKNYLQEAHAKFIPDVPAFDLNASAATIFSEEKYYVNFIDTTILQIK